MRRKEKMAKKQKIYAVKKGNQTGIFYTWEECQAATKGFSSPDFNTGINYKLKGVMIHLLQSEPQWLDSNRCFTFLRIKF